MRPDILTTVQEFMEAMARLREQRGHLITLQDVRLIDHEALSAMEAQVVQRFDETSVGVVGFLLQDDALTPIVSEIQELEGRIGEVDRALDLEPITEGMDRTGEGLELLIEVIGGLDVGDPNDRTRILENISEVFGQLNRVRAVLEGRRKELGRAEAKAEFAAQFKLLSQGVSSALSMADSPEKCDEQLSRLMVQLEELEGRFGEFEEYLLDITVKRDEISQAFESKRQQLMEARQRRIGALFASGERILTAVHRRSGSFKEADKLNGYFASDSMVLKLRKLAEQLTELGDSNKAEDLLGKLKSAKQRALRALRDRADLFEDGAAIIKFGRHRFAVNTQSFDLTIVPRGEGMAIHLTGTEFYDAIEDEDFLATRPYWSQALVSETPEVYRAEYLAARMLFDAEANENGLNIDMLDEDRLTETGLLERVRGYAANRYEEGYERGVHDADAARILEKLLHLRQTAGLLRYPPVPRAAAVLFWAQLEDRAEREALHRQARSLGRMRQVLPNPTAMRRFARQLGEAMQPWVTAQAPSLAAELDDADWVVAGDYLAEELAAERPRFVLGAQAAAILDGLRLFLDGHRTPEGQGARQAFDDDLRALEGRLDERLALARPVAGGLPRQHGGRPPPEARLPALRSRGGPRGRQEARPGDLPGQHDR